MPKQENGAPKKVSGDFTEELLTAALLHAHYVLESSSMPYVVLGDIAYQMKNNEPLHGHKIVLGVLKRYCMPELTSLLKVMDTQIETMMDGWRIVHEEVPVVIKIMEKDYPTLINPDIVFHSVETFFIPNPFEVYWKGPHLDI